jgi:hypothetical protein
MRALSFAAAAAVAAVALTTSTDRIGSFQSSEAASITVRAGDDGPMMRHHGRERIVIRHDRGRHYGWERGHHYGWDHHRGVERRTIIRHSDGSVTRRIVRRSIDD